MSYSCILSPGKLCDGCMQCQIDKEHSCPICGERLENEDLIYSDYYGDIIGCGKCISIDVCSEKY